MPGYKRPGVYIDEVLLPPAVAVGPTANAAGAVVGAFSKGPETTTLVTSWYEFTKTFGGYNAAFPATFGVGSFFQNGGRELYVRRILGANAAAADVDVLDTTDAVVFNVAAKNRGEDGNNLRVTVSAGSVAGSYTITVTEEQSESGNVNSTADDIVRERYENVVLNDATSSDYITTVINLVSTRIVISAVDGTKTPELTVFPLSGGANGNAPTSTAYVSGQTNVFETAFGSIDRPLVLFLPGINETLTSGATTVYTTAVSWAASTGLGFVVAETPDDQDVAGALAFAAGLSGYSNAAVYYPHLYITDPVGRGSGALRKIGPSGAVAGFFLGNDAARGVFKAPAGLDARLAGIISPERSFTSAELDNMNSSQNPVNPIRSVPGAGLAIMGARTLKQDGTANKYVNMRRSLIFLRKSLKDLTEFALFENNDERLWGRIRTGLSLFLNEYWSQGGLRGATITDAFYVKVDAENNPANLIANGEVNIEVGVALQYPAEFVVISLSQKTLE